jgi:hypothetical protein
MTKINVIVSDADQSWHARIDQAWACALIASLSADPTNLGELHAATQRFLHPRYHQTLFRSAVAAPTVCMHSSDGAPVECAIDLAARMMFVPWDQAHEPIPVRYVDLPGTRDAWLEYDLHPSWQFHSDLSNWAEVVAQRRSEFASAGVTDWRATLYGTPLITHLVTALRRRSSGPEVTGGPYVQSLVKAPDSPRGPCAWDDEQPLFDEEPWRSLLREVHADWLLTCPADWSGISIRDALYRDRRHLDRDLCHREAQWSMLGWCPPGLRETDTAFRYGGCGVHEVILYYDLVRSLAETYLKRCLSRSVELPTAQEDIDWLSQQRDVWLTTPQADDLLGKCPREVIDTERKRIPMRISPEQAIVDCECPVCRLMAGDDQQPIFWHLDGYDQDQDYPFDWHSDDDEILDRNAGSLSERLASHDGSVATDDDFDRSGFRGFADRSGSPFPPIGANPSDNIWQRVYVGGMPGKVPPEVDLFAVAACTGELIQDVRDRDGSQQLVDELNRQVDNFGAAFREPGTPLLTAVAHRFCEMLDQIETSHPELGPKVQDLQTRLVGLSQLSDPSP